MKEVKKKYVITYLSGATEVIEATDIAEACIISAGLNIYSIISAQLLPSSN